MVNWVISSSVLILSVIALRFLFRGKIQLKVQYALWGLVLLRLLIPVNIGHSPLSLANFRVPVAEQQVQTSHIDTEQQPNTAPNFALPEQERPTEPQQPTEGPAHTATKPMNLAEMVPTVLTGLWVVGGLMVGIVFLGTNLHFRKKLEASRRVVSQRRCYLPVYVTDSIGSPCLFGLLHPAIYVTEEVAEDDTLFRHTIAHELCHYRHKDHIWVVLRGVCLVLHWYNPLVWCAAVLSQQDAELACDEDTIRRLGEGERKAYGRTLIEMTCQNRRNLLTTATTMTADKQLLKERITMIAQKPKRVVTALLAVIVLAGVCVGCTFTGAVGRTAQQPDGTMESQENKAWPVYDIEGQQLEDGAPVSVHLTMGIERLLHGEEAYQELRRENPQMELPAQGKEYLIVTLHVTYEDGDAELLRIYDNRATMASAEIKFFRPTKSGNSLEVSEYLPDCIYGTELKKGESAYGSVAFLTDADSTEPLVFHAYDRVTKLALTNEPKTDGVANTVDKIQSEWEQWEQILEGKSVFNNEYGKAMNLQEFCEAMAQYSDIKVELLQYTVLDMDRDGTTELVLQILVNDQVDHGVLVLHQTDRDLQGYTMSLRQMMELKHDGSFSYSGSVDDGIALAVFDGDGISYRTIANLEVDDDGQTVHYYADGKPITETEYDRILDKQDAKKNAVWIPYSGASAIAE